MLPVVVPVLKHYQYGRLESTEACATKLAGCRLGGFQFLDPFLKLQDLRRLVARAIIRQL